MNRTDRGTTRQDALRAALVAAGGAAVAACGAGGADGAGSAPATDARPVEIEYWSVLAETHPEGKGRLEALKLSEAANAGAVKIRYEQAAGSNMEKVIAAASAGTPPNLLVDRPNNAAMLFDAGIGADHEAAFKGLPAWAKVKAALPPSFLEGATWRGKQVALPLYVVNQAMVYAPDHLEKAGVRPPAATWTWNDFLEIAKRTARPPDVWALDKAWSASQWQIWAGSNGALMFNREKTKVTLTQPESVAAMEFLSNLTHGLGLVPPEDIGELLVKGQSVFEPNGPYRMPIWREAGVRFEPILPPRGPQKPTEHNWGSMYSLTVLKATDPAKQRAAALAALGALAEDAQVAMCKLHLGLPASKAALASPAYQQVLAADRQMRTFADMFPSCWILPAIPSFAQIDTVRGELMTKVYKRQESIRTALQLAEQEGQRLLDADLARSARG